MNKNETEKTEGKYEIVKLQNKMPLRGAKASCHVSILIEQVFLDQDLHQFVPVDLADHAAGAAVVGNVGGICGKQIADDLVDGVIALLGQSLINIPEDLAHILFVIAGYGKFQGIFSRHGNQPPYRIQNIVIITEIVLAVKG